ncbi:MAG: T9SS type A sorting domain-containing protein, partial [Bacteroidota bacterium]|nr:T9SS type A sorting domain-containing protein [Bacteroidota bacterium]
SLVYYKKGTVEWGTPVAPSCSVLVPVEDHKQPVPITVDIIPNPVINTAQVRISGIEDITGMTFRLYDNLGREVLLIPVSDKVFDLNCGELLHGMYFYRLTGISNSTLSIGKLIVN